MTLPVFGFGSAHLGELYAPVDEDTSRTTLDAAWEGGVRYYDTAPWYGRGLAEHRVGGFLRTRPRDDFQITTKVGRTLHRPADPKSFNTEPWAGGLNFEISFDYSYDGIMRSYEGALQRLALDTVDALVIHDLDTRHHEGETFLRHQKDMADSGVKALQELKSHGEIQAYGMGINTDTALVETAARVELDFTLVAMPYTLLDQGGLHTGMATCLKRNISVVIGAPFASGILVTGSGTASKYGYGSAPGDVRKKARAIEAVCRSHGVSLAAAALQFPLAHPAVVSVIPGAVRPGEVNQNLASLEEAIPPDLWSDLKTEDLIDAEAPTPPPAGS